MRGYIVWVLACCGVICFCILNLWGLVQAKDYKESQIVIPAHYTSTSRTLKDANNKTMGYIKGERVYDAKNKLLGYVKSTGTTTDGGRTLSKSKLPGLLFCK